MDFDFILAEEQISTGGGGDSLKTSGPAVSNSPPTTGPCTNISIRKGALNWI